MGGISFQGIGFQKAVELSPRIVIGRVLETGDFPFEGAAFRFHRVEVLRALKGAESRELRIFDPGAWFRHSRAELIRAGVISYAETRYQGGMPAEEIEEGAEILYFLGDEPVPAGFPADAVFLRFEGSHDRPDRASALQSGPVVGFGELARLKKGVSVRFPDGLEITLVGNGHKRPMVDGPRKAWSTVDLKQGDAAGRLQLNHHVEPDGRESWDSLRWGTVVLELKAIDSGDSSSLIVHQAPLCSPP